MTVDLIVMEEKQFNRMNYRDLRHERLDVLDDWLSNGYLVSWADVPRTLLEARLVSVHYSMRNLMMDVWYLKRGYCTSYSDELEGMSHFSTRVLFRIILRSLLDLNSGRPCDLGSWKLDIPSDFCCCSHEYHLCYQSAEEYLTSVDEEYEEQCGLSKGKIRYMIRKIKEDPIFKIGSVLASEMPSSFVALRSIRQEISCIQ